MSTFEAGESRTPGVFVPDPGPTTSVFVPPEPPEPEPVEEDVSPEALAHAYANGFAAGEAAARENLPVAEVEELKSAAVALQRCVDAIEERGRGQLVAEPRAVVDLALSIAEHLLCTRLGDDAEALAARVSRAIQNMSESEPIRIEISARDHGTLEELRDDLATQACADIEISAHAGLAPGEFRLSAGASEADARIPALLASVREVLAEECTEEEDAG